MINLLPEKEQKEIFREYKLRVVAMSLGTIIALSVFACVILTPSYIMVAYKKVDVLSRTVSEKEEDKTARDALDTKIQAGRRNIKTLAIKDDKINITKVIDAVIKKRGTGVKIQSIDFGILESNPTIKILGVANTRNSLVSFTDSLKLEPTIKSVEVPISNFAKDSNIQFTFTITAN